MESFVVHEGLVAPMDRANVDTDLIMPKQFLSRFVAADLAPIFLTICAISMRGCPTLIIVIDLSTRIFPSIFHDTKVLLFCLRARISGVALVANTHPGLWWTMGFAR